MKLEKPIRTRSQGFNLLAFCPISLIVIIFFLTCLSHAYGAGITYKDVIKEAVNTSARLNVKAEDIDISEANYRQSRASLYPEFNLNTRVEKFESLLDNAQNGLSTIAGEVVSGAQDEWRATASFSGEYSLSNFYKKNHEISYYERLKESVSYEYVSEEKKLLREITDTYSALSEGKIKLEYTDEIIKRLRNIYALKKRLHKEGEISYEELLKTEVEIENAEKERSGIKREIKESIARLSLYTGKTFKEDEEVEKFSSDGRSFSDTAVSRIEDSSEYMTKQKELEALREKMKAIKNNALPDVSIYTRYDFYGSDTEKFRNSLDNFRKTAFTTGILASIPLFDGGRRKWGRVRSIHEIKRQEESLKVVKEEKLMDIETLQIGYSELSKTIDHYTRLINNYRQLFDITKKAHKLGERSMVDMLEMEKDVLSIERDAKVVENSRAAIEKKLFLETDYKGFMDIYLGQDTRRLKNLPIAFSGDK
ncbi:MAG: hypothetical protein CVV37_06445 [Nitrospira bacterium HGW-Nitrospira-1]|nr:MAG: hypothetical protein CVV37_06445 [Nitrospira bacterium HGW-Nitrospira-1]